MQMMAINEITTRNKYLRTNSDVEMLKKSIETIGLINPITINEKNELIAGGRRFTAMKELGFTEVAVSIISDSALHQELISIDENLVRQDLTKIEIEKNLNRGREIYEELYPEALKVDEEDVSGKAIESNVEQKPDDKKSFLTLTSEKTGLSKKSIKQAINRDAKSSERIKELRSHGEINASQANELIRLKPEDQDAIVEYIKDKPAKDIKKFVDSVNVNGLDKAITHAMETPALAREYTQLMLTSKKCSRLASKIILEQMDCDHPEADKIMKSLEDLKDQIEEIINLNSDRSYSKQSDYQEHSFQN